MNIIKSFYEREFKGYSKIEMGLKLYWIVNILVDIIFFPIYLLEGMTPDAFRMAAWGIVGIICIISIDSKYK